MEHACGIFSLKTVFSESIKGSQRRILKEPEDAKRKQDAQAQLVQAQQLVRCFTRQSQT
jgi:hypothetical protein